MRIIAVFFLIVSLCACSAIRPTQIKCEPVTDFQCTVTCEQNEDTFVFDLTSRADGSFSASVLQPENLKGVCFISNENGYTVDANGITDTFRKENFTQSSPVRMLFEAMQSFLFTGAETLTDKGDGRYTASAMVNSLLAYAEFSADGRLLAIRFPDQKTVFHFAYEK